MKKLVASFLLLAVLSAVVFVTTQPVGAYAPPPVSSRGPAEGKWTWDDDTVTGTIVPQYKLAETYDPDYALLQSNGINISGPTMLCHPYPGGQFGWNAEIRVLTSTGWVSVPSVNQWVPDEEGQFMTCAQVWYRGTYAVFGYWVKPADWNPIPEAF